MSGVTGVCACKKRSSPAILCDIHLTCVGAFVQGGFVHRDLRWANVVCTAQRKYFLIDLELAGKTGRCNFKLESAAWQAACDMQNGDCFYTATSDMYMVGNLMQAALDEQPQMTISPEGRDLMRSLLQKRLDAAAALAHPWIACPGTTCTAAGTAAVRGQREAETPAESAVRSDPINSGCLV